MNPNIELYLKFAECANNEFICLIENTKFRQLIQQCSRQFVLQLAYYCRYELGLIIAPLVLLAEASIMTNNLSNECKSDVRDFTSRIINHPTDCVELICYYFNYIRLIDKINLSAAIKKGINDYLKNISVAELNQYQYYGKVQLRDVIALTHYKPRYFQIETIARLMNELKYPFDLPQNYGYIYSYFKLNEQIICRESNISQKPYVEILLSIESAIKQIQEIK